MTLVAMAPEQARGQEAPAPPPASFVGQLGGLSLDAATFGEHYALVGMGPRLLVVDLSQPESPRWLGLGPVLGGAVQAVVVNGNRAYVALGAAGVATLDLSRPEAPSQVSHGARNTAGRCRDGAAHDLAIHDGRLFVAEAASGLSEFSLLNPDEPMPLSCLSQTMDGRRLVIHDHKAIAFLADDQGRGWTVDLSVSGQPRVVSRNAFQARDLALEGDRLVGLAPDGILRQWAVETPDALRPLGSLAVGKSSQRLIVRGDRVWVGTAGGQILEVDIANPDAPRLERRANIPGAAVPAGVSAILPWADGRFLVLFNGALDGAALLDAATDGQFCGEGPGGLAMLDAAMQVLGSLATLSCRIQTMVLSGGRYLWLAERLPDGTGADRVLVFDVVDPDQPRPVGQLVLPDGQPVLQLIHAGPVLAILSWGKVFLATDADGEPRIMSRLDAVPAGHVARVLADSQRHLLVVASGEELVTADIGDLARPRILARINLAGIGQDGQGRGPSLIGLHDLGGGMVVLLRPANDLLVVDVRDAEHPRPAFLWPESGPLEGLVVKDGWIFIAQSWRWSALDMTRRTSARQVGRSPRHGEPTTALASGSWILTLDRQAGLSALTIGDPFALTLGWTVAGPFLPVPPLEPPESDAPALPNVAESVGLQGGLVGALDHLGLIVYRLGDEVPRGDASRLFLPVVGRGQRQLPARPAEQRLEFVERWTGRPLDKGRALLAVDGLIYVGVDLDRSDESAVAILDARSGDGLGLLGISQPLGQRIEALALGSRGLYAASLGTDGHSMLHMLDVTVPSRFRGLGSVELDYPPTALAVAGDRVYILVNSPVVAGRDLTGEGLWSFDFGDAAKPRRDVEWDLDGFTHLPKVTTGMAIHDGRLYLSGAREGVQIYAIESSGRIAPVGGLGGPGAGLLSRELGMTDLVVRGERLIVSSSAFTGRETSGLWEFDLSDPDRPVEGESLLDLRLRRDRGVGQPSSSLLEGELGGIRLAWEGDKVYTRLESRLQAYRFAPYGGFSLLDETGLAADVSTRPDALHLSRSLVAATAGKVFAPTDEGLAVYTLRPR